MLMLKYTKEYIDAETNNRTIMTMSNDWIERTKFSNV